MTTTIKNTSFADYDDELRTVSVTAESNGAEVRFCVQIVDGRYRGDLGYWIIPEGGFEDINPDDYPHFDIDKIVAAAESFVKSKTVITRLNDNCDVYFRVIDHKLYEVIEENKNYISAEMSQGVTQYRTLGAFNSAENAYDFASAFQAGK